MGDMVSGGKLVYALSNTAQLSSESVENYKKKKAAEFFRVCTITVW
jgi:hypothetical protein